MEPSRDGKRSRLRRINRPRKGRRRARARTIANRRLTREEVRRSEELKDFQYEKPKTRAECRHGIRPCPFVSCRYHLYLDVKENGSIKINFPDLEVWQMEETCALDVAERGAITLEEIGEIMNLTRERVRQLEVNALFKLKMAEESDILADFLD